MFFAETPTGETVGWMALATVAGGAAQWLLSYLRDLWREGRQAKSEADTKARDARKQDESDALGRMEKLLDRVERQLAESERDNAKLRESASRTQETANRAVVRAERAVVWIRHLESRLREHKIPFDPWTEAEEPAARGRGDAETDVGADGGYQ